MSSEIISHCSVPKLICQNQLCQKQTQRARVIFSCNLQKGLEDASITNCKGCIGKQKNSSINYCQANFEDLCLVLRTQRKLEQEILVKVEELQSKVDQIAQEGIQQINSAKERIHQIGQTIKQQCLFQENSPLEECLKNNQQGTLDLVIKMIKELREKIIIEDKSESSRQQLNQNVDTLNIIYENGTIIIDDFLKKKISQMSQMLNCFEQQISQLHSNNYNFTKESNIINSNYKQIGKAENLSAKKIYNLRFNRSNNMFAYGSSNLDKNKSNCIEIWKIEDNKIRKVQVLSQYPDVTALCFNNKDDSLFTGGQDSKLIYWQRKPDGKYEEKMFNQNLNIMGQINCVEINQKSNILAVGSEELCIFQYNNNVWELITRHQKEIKTITFSNCNQIIIAQCMTRTNEETVQFFKIQNRSETVDQIGLGEAIQTQQIGQMETTTRFMFINLLNQVNFYIFDNNQIKKIENDAIKQLNSIEKSGIGYCSINNTFNLLALSQNDNNNQVTQILKINEQNQVTLIQSIQQLGQKLFFSNNGQVLVIWNGDSLFVFKDKTQIK